MCRDIKVMESREVCDQKIRSVPSISCETRMKEIELKEICVDIELQLPREECRTEEREEWGAFSGQALVNDGLALLEQGGKLRLLQRALSRFPQAEEPPVAELSTQLSSQTD